MTSLHEDTQVPATRIRRSHLAKTFDGSHPLNVFAEQPISNAWKGSGYQRHIPCLWNPFSDIWQCLWYPEPFRACEIGCSAKKFNG